jgi:hypothetical protein
LIDFFFDDFFKVWDDDGGRGLPIHLGQLIHFSHFPDLMGQKHDLTLHL